MSNEVQFILKTEYITLSQVIKAAGFADMGSDAKLMVQNGWVLVNGEVDDRRGRKLRQGDKVTLKSGDSIQIV